MRHVAQVPNTELTACMPIGPYKGSHCCDKVAMFRWQVEEMMIVFGELHSTWHLQLEWSFKKQQLLWDERKMQVGLVHKSEVRSSSHEIGLGLLEGFCDPSSVCC